MSSKTDGDEYEISMIRESCMYSTTELLVNGKKTDFSQLGWVAAWVLDDSAEDYHNRT